MNCTECGYNLDGIQSPACPECGAGRDAAAIARARADRDSLAEFALWGSVALGPIAILSAFISPALIWPILISGTLANFFLAVLIHRAGRATREHATPLMRTVRSTGLCFFRIAAMWFACFASAEIIYLIWNMFRAE